MKQLAAGWLMAVLGLVALFGQSSASAWAGPDGPNAQLIWGTSLGPLGQRDAPGLPLYEAIFAQDQRRVASILDKGASPNALLYPHRWSPLMVAAAYNNRPIAELLVQHGADLNYVSDDKIYPTPLAVALAYGRFHPNIDHPDFAMLHDLLKAGADVNVEFGFHQDIAKLSATFNQMKVLNELLDHGYHRDLADLKKWIEIGHVAKDLQADKDRAIAKIDGMMRKP